MNTKCTGQSNWDKFISWDQGWIKRENEQVDKGSTAVLISKKRACSLFKNYLTDGLQASSGRFLEELSKKRGTTEQNSNSNKKQKQKQNVVINSDKIISCWSFLYPAP